MIFCIVKHCWQGRNTQPQKKNECVQKKGKRLFFFKKQKCKGKQNGANGCGVVKAQKGNAAKTQSIDKCIVFRVRGRGYLRKKKRSAQIQGNNAKKQNVIFHLPAFSVENGIKIVHKAQCPKCVFSACNAQKLIFYKRCYAKQKCKLYKKKSCTPRVRKGRDCIYKKEIRTFAVCIVAERNFAAHNRKSKKLKISVIIAVCKV